jgi:hypothetical protein
MEVEGVQEVMKVVKEHKSYYFRIRFDSMKCYERSECTCNIKRDLNLNKFTLRRNLRIYNKICESRKSFNKLKSSKDDIPSFL